MSKLGFEVQTTNISAQKLDSILLGTFEIVIAGFQVKNKLDKAWFFQESFLLVNINLKVILEILFLILVIKTSSLQKKSLPRGFTLPRRLY